MNKKVVDVEHHPDRVVVKCEDGTSYEGDILAGADGIYSKTREALWELAGRTNPELVAEDKAGEIFHIPPSSHLSSYLTL